MPVPPNTDFTTAVDLGTLPQDVTLQVDSGGTTYTVYYSFVAASTGVVGAWAFGDLVTYRPTIYVYTGDPNSPTWVLSISALNVPIQFPVTEGETYFLKIAPNSGNPTPANLALNVQMFENADAPAGSIVIPDDTDGFPAAIIDPATGNVIHFIVPFPAGEWGDAFDNGWFAVEDISDGSVKVYDETLTLQATLLPFGSAQTYGAMRISPALQDLYVGVSNIGGFAKITTVSDAGVVGGITWTLTGAGLTALAPNSDGSKIYVAGQGGSINTAVKTWLTGTNAFGSDLYAAQGANTSVVDMLVLADDTVIVAWLNTSTQAVDVRHIAANGTLIATYSTTSLDLPIPKLAYDSDDHQSFVWLWTHAANGVSTFHKIDTSTMTATTVDGEEFEGGAYAGAQSATPSDRFGFSFSCPFLLLRTPITVEEPSPSTEEAAVTITPIEFEADDSVCEQVSRRLGDPDHRIWSADEIDAYLAQGVKEMCTLTRLIWDWVYVENLPRGMSYNHKFELALIDGASETTTEPAGPTWKYGPGDGMGDGQANYTAEFERRMWDDQLNGAPTGRSEDTRAGWARHTYPDEIPWLTVLDADQLQGVDDLPHRLTEVERATWDKRTIDADIHRNHRYEDSRYEIQTGEVQAYTWRKDGPRAFRKIRVPAALADYYTIDGLWGSARDVTDLDYVGDTADIEGTWGAPRQVPGEHPIGPRHTREPWGLPRRFYRDGNNVRVEHWRTAYFDCIDTELPERYRAYVVWFAMYQALSRQSPGQDLKLAGWYRERWTKGLERIKNRIRRQQNERTGRMGGADPAPNIASRPPRPRLPWQYGKRIR